MTNELEELRVARKTRDAFRKEVVDWMSEQGAKGHFRHNEDAPAWAAYHAAEAALDKLREQCGT